MPTEIFGVYKQDRSTLMGDGWKINKCFGVPLMNAEKQYLMIHLKIRLIR